jgi:hypothetical protein
MAWDAGVLDDVYRDFARAPEKAMTQCARIGDQEWLELKAPRAALWENLVPGHVVSFKRDCQAGLPANARVVDFHGKLVKPWNCPMPWVKEHYHDASSAQ